MKINFTRYDPATFVRDEVLVRGVLSGGQAALVTVPGATADADVWKVALPLLAAAFERGEWFTFAPGGGCEPLAIRNGRVIDPETNEPIRREPILLSPNETQ